MKKAINKKVKNINNLNSVLYASLGRHWKAFQSNLKKYRNNKDKKSQKAVHNLRVELRRTVSVLEIINELYNFKTKNQQKKISAELLKYLDKYTELRDVQVHLFYADRRLSKYKIKPFYSYLKNKEKILLKKTSKRSKKLELNNLKKQIRKVKKLLLKKAISEDKVKARINNALSASFNEVLKYKPQIKKPDIKRIHKMRIAFKKYRYKVEALSPLLPKITSKVLREMHSYQQLLGKIHDLDILAKESNKFFSKRKGKKKLKQKVINQLNNDQQKSLRLFMKLKDKIYVFKSNINNQKIFKK